MKTTWIQIPITEGPLDIWIHKAEIEKYCHICLMSHEHEHEILFGSKPELTFEEKTTFMAQIQLPRLLELTASMYGNKVERTITIIDSGIPIEKWKRIPETSSP